MGEVDALYSKNKTSELIMSGKHEALGDKIESAHELLIELNTRHDIKIPHIVDVIEALKESHKEQRELALHYALESKRVK